MKNIKMSQKNVITRLMLRAFSWACLRLGLNKSHESQLLYFIEESLIIVLFIFNFNTKTDK